MTVVEADSLGQHRRRRRGGIPLIGAGMVCALLAFLTATTWRAQPARAATLFSFSFQAQGHGFQFFDADPANGNQEGEVPTAQASLANGPVGLGLASMAWPGPLAANAGSLVLVLQPTCTEPLPPNPACPVPAGASALNYPVRAEAHSGQNPPTTTYNSAPGVSLTATAKADSVDADATVQNATGDPGTFGPTHVHSTTTLANDTGTAESSSLVQNISLAGGVIKIGSVQSTAKATTDGAKSDGTAATTVSGMTIAGTPATVDQDGLHIASQSQPLNSVVNQTAQQALAQAKIQIILSAPIKETQGATTTVDAGSLIVIWDQGGAVWSVTIGGAQAKVTAAPGGDDALIDLSSLDTGSDSSTALDTSATSGDSSSLDTGSSGGGLTSLSSGSSSGTATPAVASAPKAAAKPAGSTPTTALGGIQPIAHGRPVGGGSIVLGLLAAALLALGLFRLSGSALAEPAGVVCPLAEDDQ